MKLADRFFCYVDWVNRDAIFEDFIKKNNTIKRTHGALFIIRFSQRNFQKFLPFPGTGHTQSMPEHDKLQSHPPLK